ncbi:hypothetical protein [Lentzea kentuckyensis]|uniref:hypothetical protein n=1 Tax=Lentzea kentuckyensis TaxID=360086 RepID=UPI000A3AE71C|nr:hypothetical protein [Lentzea kentuckyensis]
MNAVGITVLALFTLSVIGVGIAILCDRPERDGGSNPDREPDPIDDDAWIAELRRLNEAMPYVRKHRARAARNTMRTKQ